MSENSPAYAVEVVLGGIPKPLTYRLDAPFESIGIGAQVVVELGKRKTEGWVVNKLSIDEACEKSNPKQAQAQLSLLQPSPGHAFKPVLDAQQAFEEKQMELFQWIANYYGSSIYEVISCAVPTKSRGRLVTMLILTEQGRELLKNSEEFEKLQKRAPLQKELLEKLQNFDEPVSFDTLELDSSRYNGTKKSLEKKGLISSSKLSTSEIFDFDKIEPVDTPHDLTSAQANAVKEISDSVAKNSFEAHLLFGITGSGKTEVYLQTIKEVLDSGKSALVIVPEIALTPQLLGRFVSRLGVPISVLHSQVSATKRWRDWQALLSGKVRVAIGARSSVFAPMDNLGIIVVDEEHEQSYKQSDGLRYHGRDVAVMRAKLADCPIVLGSATPSFESLLNVKKKRYNLIELPERATKRSLPEMNVVDLSLIKKKKMVSENISPQLHAELEKALENKEQAVILYNRRGYSSYLQCDDCGEVLKCPDCSVTFTYHKYQDRLSCHYCGITVNPPKHCPQCRNPKTVRYEGDGSETKEIGILHHRGSGTEKVIDEIAELFPEAKLIRMDRDTTSSAFSYEYILETMKKGKADILVGTQMIAKGHDLPGVTLVGIIDADIGLHLPDFRASERVFQLITQASGRAGRGEKPGRVILQTRQPNHPTIVATATGRFKAFARYEMDYRDSLDYPPYGKLMRLVISPTNPHTAKEMSFLIGKLSLSLIEKMEADVKLLGPSPAHYEKLRGRFRWNFLVKATSSNVLSSLAKSLAKWKIENKNMPEFRLSCDVDPFDML